MNAASITLHTKAIGDTHGASGVAGVRRRGRPEHVSTFAEIAYVGDMYEGNRKKEINGTVNDFRSREFG